MNSVSQKIIIACMYCKSLYRVTSSLSGRPVTCTKCRRTFLASEAQINLSSSEDEGFLLCKIALNYGFVTEKNLEDVMVEYTRCKQHDETVTLENILASHGGMDQDNLDLMKSIRDNWNLRLAEKKFAQEAVRNGLISKDTARNALIRQAQIFQKSRSVRLLCDLLTESGDLKASQCAKILKNKFALSDQALSASNNPPPTQRPTSDMPKKTLPKTIETTQYPEKKLAEEPSPSIGPVTPINKTENEDSNEPELEINREPQDTAHEDKNKITEPSPVEDVPPSPAGMDDEKPDIASQSPPVNQDTPPGIADSDQCTTSANTSSETTPSPDGFKIIPVSGLELMIDIDCMTATLKVPDGIDPSTVPVKHITEALAEEEIIYGISEDSLIKGFLNSKIFREKPFKIAEGISPKPGKKGSIKFYFDTDYLKIGAINESGNIDFKNRGEIPFVKEGTLLAEIKPSIQGTHGKDIYGRDIPVQEIQDVYLRCDTGTRMSEDSTKVFAANDGQPKLSFGNRISVLSELTIPGDVGFETGHVEFEGNIIVNGTVQNDFIVKGANIKANELTGATIIAKGDVDIKSGISNSNLVVEGNVSAKFIHKSSISAYGNVMIEKEVIDSEINISGICSVERGKLISSKVSAKLGVEAQQIGTDMSKPCHLRIGVDDHIEKETDIIEDDILKQKTLLAEQEEYLKSLEDREKETHKSITELAHIQDRSQLEQKELSQKLEELENAGDAAGIEEIQKKIDDLSQKARDADNAINESFDEQDQLLEDIKASKEKIIEYKDIIFDLTKQKKDKIAWAKNIKGIAYVKTSKSLLSGTVISGKNITKTIKESLRNTRIREVKAPDTADGWEMKIS